MSILNNMKKVLIGPPDHTTKVFINLRKKLKDNHYNLFKPIYIIKYQKLTNKLNCFMPISAVIPQSTVFPHGLSGIFISQGAVLGENCVIFHQVTIGSNNLKDSKGFGSPQIGNNVRIGANNVITTDIPDNATAVAASFRLITHNEERKNEFESY